MYREPAEDEEEKLDAAEVDAFRKKLRAGERRVRWQTVLVAFAVMGAFLVIVSCALVLTHANSSKLGRPLCHTAYAIHVDNGTPTRTEYLVCEDAGP